MNNSSELKANSHPSAEHRAMVTKLITIVICMFGFGYALVPIYKKLCEVTGINILAFREKENTQAVIKNSQIDTSRLITVEFDANVQGPWRMIPTKKSLQIHPGQLITVMYEIANQKKKKNDREAGRSRRRRKGAGRVKPQARARKRSG